MNSRSVICFSNECVFEFRSRWATTSFLHRRYIISATYINRLAFRQSRRIATNVECLPANNVIDLRQNLRKRILNIHGLQRRRLHEERLLSFSEGLGVLRRHRSQMTQIAFVSNQHNHNVRIRMIPQLLQPSRNVFERDVTRDVVHDQSANCSSIVRARDCTIPVESINWRRR